MSLSQKAFRLFSPVWDAKLESATIMRKVHIINAMHPKSGTACSSRMIEESTNSSLEI